MLLVFIEKSRSFNHQCLNQCGPESTPQLGGSEVGRAHYVTLNKTTFGLPPYPRNASTSYSTLCMGRNANVTPSEELHGICVLTPNDHTVVYTVKSKLLFFRVFLPGWM